MGFSSKVKEDALVLCARHCCLCHQPKGLKIEVHHIVHRAEGGADILDNAIALCFDCHADMRSYDHKHPKGVKYTREELIRRRDDWYAVVKQNGVAPPKDPAVDSDISVFRHLLKVLPWNGSIGFIKTNNFSGFPFDLERLNDIDAFLDECENPGFRFSRLAIEQERIHLFVHLTEFRRAIGRNTFRINNTKSHSSVPSEWEIHQPENFYKAVEEIESAATAACDAYTRLIEGGRSILGVVSFG